MISMDEADRISFKAGKSPLEGGGQKIRLHRADHDFKIPHSAMEEEISLNGAWEISEDGSEQDRLSTDWEDSFSADVPCSIHMALFKAGRIPDPNVGRNQLIAQQYSYKTWWLKKTFSWESCDGLLRLEFNGIANTCSIWLNGEFLTDHEGMFGGPFVDITGKLLKENTLIIKLEPIPQSNNGYMSSNDTWNNTVVINNVYGWHYSNLESIGVWNSVIIRRQPPVEFAHPFIAEEDYTQGLMRLLVPMKAQKAPWSGSLKFTIAPRNFEGVTYCYEEAISSEYLKMEKSYEFSIPDFQLWWPVDLGNPDLYKLTVCFTPEDGASTVFTDNFGIRRIEMTPLPEGPKPELFNWTFVVNGKKTFIKGSNWCTIDALMDFQRERYDRFLSLARDQHVQFLRAWGCGMPESDDFFDLCDLYGIMIMQEWPTAWNSHDVQPYGMLEDVVIRHTLRLRNHPSLAIYCGGNESDKPFGTAIDMMGRLCIELDGTRTFHRGEPFGGSMHNYDVYWGRQHMDQNLSKEAPFWGEFGLASYPCCESIMKYVPDDEKKVWPPIKGGGFEYHTPIFGKVGDMDILAQYAGYFVSENCTLEQFVIGSQLAQGIGVKPVLERARTRFPYCTGALYYKLNDNAPSATWSTIDWYGTPKLSYYILQDAFAPLQVCILFTRLNFSGTPQTLPIFLLDDADALADKNWRVNVRVFNGQLKEIKSVAYSGNASIQAPCKLGDLSLSSAETMCSPLFIVCDVETDDGIKSRNFYFRNYEYTKGCLFNLPRASLSYEVGDGKVVIQNVGQVPAVGLMVSALGESDTLTASDNFIWLDAGEIQTIAVSRTNTLQIGALNSI